MDIKLESSFCKDLILLCQGDPEVAIFGIEIIIEGVPTDVACVKGLCVDKGDAAILAKGDVVDFGAVEKLKFIEYVMNLSKEIKRYLVTFPRGFIMSAV